MNLSFVVGLVLILAVTLIPGVKDLFHVADSMLWQEWLIAIGLSLAIIPLVELQKLIEKAIEKGKEKKQQQE